MKLYCVHIMCVDVYHHNPPPHISQAHHMAVHSITASAGTLSIKMFLPLVELTGQSKYGTTLESN